MEQELFLYLKVFLVAMATKTQACLGQKQQNFTKKSTSANFYHFHILCTWGYGMHETRDVFPLTVIFWLPWQPENRHSGVKNSKILMKNLGGLRMLPSALPSPLLTN